MVTNPLPIQRPSEPARVLHENKMIKGNSHDSHLVNINGHLATENSILKLHQQQLEAEKKK